MSVIRAVAQRPNAWTPGGERLEVRQMYKVYCNFVLNTSWRSTICIHWGATYTSMKSPPLVWFLTVSVLFPTSKRIKYFSNKTIPVMLLWENVTWVINDQTFICLKQETMIELTNKADGSANKGIEVAPCCVDAGLSPTAILPPREAAEQDGFPNHYL